MPHDVRFFVPAMSAWVVVAILLQAPNAGYALSLACCILLLAIWAGLLLTKSRQLGWDPDRSHASVLVVTASLCLALIAVVAFRVGFEDQVRHTPAWHQVVENSSAASFTAVATSMPYEPQNAALFSDDVRVNATITSLRLHSEESRTSVPVRLVLPAKASEKIQIGSHLSLSGKVTGLPGVQSIPYMVSVTEVHVRPPPLLLGVTNSLREQFRASASRLEGWGAQLIPGLAVGDTQLVEGDLDSAMKASSLSHLTAVSGANCAIIVGIFLFLGGALRLRRAVKILLAAFFLAAFITLVTPEPSVLRAGVMSVVALIGMVSARKGAGIAALGVAIVVLLLIDPWQATHLGFVLSVLATAGILLFTDPISRWLTRFMPRWLALTFAVPLAAQFACQPAIILIQPTLPALGVLANVLVAPAAPVATVTGLAAALLLPIWPWVGEFLTWITWWPASWIALIARTSSSIPSAQLPWIDGWFGAALLALITLTIVMALTTRSERKVQNVSDTGRGWKNTGGWRLVSVSLALSILVALSVVRPIATLASIPSNWRIFACDVGQGDGVLVRGEQGTMLIDTGYNPQEISTCLDTLGIRQIDVLVLTHDDNDHVGGLEGVAGRVRAAVIAPPTKTTQQPRPVEQILERHRVKTVIAHQGMRGSLGDVTWQIVWPLIGDVPETPNDSSVTVRMDSAELSAIFLGDLGEDAQRALMAHANPNPVDVVKVSHHGSADQLAKLYEQLRARYGIISVGADNGYGHPTAKTLRMLRQSGTTALRTDVSGALAIARDSNGKWQLWKGTPLG